MNGALFLPHSRGWAGQVEHGISIFLGDSRVSADQLDASLSHLLSSQPPLDFVHFVGYADQVCAVQAAVLEEGSLLQERLTALLGKRPVRFFHFDAVSGLHRCLDANGTPLVDSVEQVAVEQRYSLMEVFRLAGGEERAPKGTHYAKTSDSHADRFLRVSNVVEDGRHVAFLAYWLLPFLWKLDVRHVAVDTSTIYSVVFKAIQEATLRGGRSDYLPQVWSHNSHNGVERIPEHVLDDTVFVVSASTSHNLVRKLKARGVSPHRVRTLFSLSAANSTADLEGHTALCDLSAATFGTVTLGLALIENHSAMNCALCAKHFHLIKIQGDQFSIAPPRVAAVVIEKRDLDEKLRPVLSALCGRRAFAAYRRLDDERILSISLNAGAILEGEAHDKSKAELQRIRLHWANLMRRAQSQSLKLIVACDYPGSAELASVAVSQAKAALANPEQVRVVGSRGLASQQKQPGQSTLVLSAAVSDPQELLSVSRALRDVQEDGSIAYLSVGDLLPSADVVKRLKSNITMGQHGPSTFTYATCIELPLDSVDEHSSWAMERDELARLRAWLDSQHKETPIEIEERIDRLDGALADGLIDDVFWQSPEGVSLRLRSDFTLADRTLEAPVATQADLLAIVGITLTSLRHREGATRKLVQNAYERNMLSPMNFSRFNDGVLQAAILRAAKPEELAYGACDGTLSEDMLHILLDMVPCKGRSPEKSEALREFLVAFMIKRISLKREHCEKFLQRLIASTAEGSVKRVMAEYLRAVLH